MMWHQFFTKILGCWALVADQEKKVKEFKYNTDKQTVGFSV